MEGGNNTKEFYNTEVKNSGSTSKNRLGNNQSDIALALMEKENLCKDPLKCIEKDIDIESIKKISQNIFTAKNNEGKRLLINQDGKEIYKGLKFDGILKSKQNNYVLKLLNKMYELVISDNGKIILKECSGGKNVDIENIIAILKCKESMEEIREKYRKMEKSTIFSDIYFVKLNKNPLRYIVRGNGKMLSIPGFVEYEERTDGLRVKRRDGKEFKPNWYLIKEDELTENMRENEDISLKEERENLYNKIIRGEKNEGENNGFYIAQKKGDSKNRIILDGNGEIVKSIPPFEEYKYFYDGGYDLAIKVKTENGYKRYKVNKDPRREAIEDDDINIKI